MGRDGANLDKVFAVADKAGCKLTQQIFEAHKGDARPRPRRATTRHHEVRWRSLVRPRPRLVQPALPPGHLLEQRRRGRRKGDSTGGRSSPTHLSNSVIQ